jgi:hypothetical protein
MVSITVGHLSVITRGEVVAECFDDDGDATDCEPKFMTSGASVAVRRIT